MSWIKTIAPEEAEGRLKTVYERVKGPDGQVDNILIAHALRPHTLEGHMALYKAALHHSGNRLEQSYLETIGLFVSLLNGCAYCAEHHYAGLRRLLGDDGRAQEIRAALTADQPAMAFAIRESAGLLYARKLTRDPDTLTAKDAEALRKMGFDDGEILEINQAAAYFAYANRVAMGLGVSHEDEPLGLSPGRSDAPDDWSHD